MNKLQYIVAIKSLPHVHVYFLEGVLEVTTLITRTKKITNFYFESINQKSSKAFITSAEINKIMRRQLTLATIKQRDKYLQ